MVNPQALDEFKDLYKKEFGVDLEEMDAGEKAGLLLDLFRQLTVKEERTNNEVKAA